MFRRLAAILVVFGCSGRPPPATGAAAVLPDSGTAATPSGDAAGLTPGTLLDQAALDIVAVSADEQHVVVSRQYPPVDFDVVSVSGTIIPLGSSNPYPIAQFSSDGRSLLFSAPNANAPPTVRLARADGTNLRTLALHGDSGFAGRWLYYDEHAGDAVSLHRVLPPDGDPELLASFAADVSLDWFASPDGESVVYCAGKDCFLRSPAATTAVPGQARLWSPDGSWVVVGVCTVVDLAGNSRDPCNATSTAWAASPDGATLALLDTGGVPGIDAATTRIHLYSLTTSVDRVLPSPSPFDMNIYRAKFWLRFTPDGSRLIAFIGAAAFSIPVAGGEWTAIVSDGPPIPQRGAVYISPDSRIIAAPSGSNGLVLSIDGGPPHPVGGPLEFDRVSFEPAGGSRKAVFTSPYADRSVLASADGTGVWTELPNVAECDWVGRTALCLRWQRNQPNQALVLADDGRQLSVTTHDTSNWPATAQLTRHRLFYIAQAGGLYVLDHGLAAP